MLMFTLAAAFIAFGSTAAFAQAPKKAEPYILHDIIVNAFDEAEGKLEDALPKTGEAPVFFNSLSTSLFVWVVVQGEAGSFEAGRMANITVMEGKKIKTSRNVQIGLIGSEGVYFIPIYVYGSLCSEVKITAKITGQKASPAKTVKVPFMCGE